LTEDETNDSIHRMDEIKDILLIIENCGNPKDAAVLIYDAGYRKVDHESMGE